MEAVEAAMDEMDSVGEGEFLRAYGFGSPREYWVVSPYRILNSVYPSKAIAARALGWNDINGGYSQPQSACRQLEELGYTITDAEGRLLLNTPSQLSRVIENEVARVSATERDAIVIARIGQAVFRRALLVYWSGNCPFTHVSDPQLLRASHIKPWAICDDIERLDVHNGLLLSALWDAAFDQGLVTFYNDGTPACSPNLSEAALQELRPTRNEAIWLSDEHFPYLAWHRENVFQS